MKIDFIYIDSGGGHRAAATALAAVIRQQSRPWAVCLLNLQDLLSPIDFIRKATGVPFQDVYNIMLRRGWTLGTAQLIRTIHFIIRRFHRQQVRVLADYWAQNRPDMVVSLIPHFNRALRESLDRSWPGIPMATVLTDIADYPPHFWIERQDQYVICGSAKAVEQARAAKLPESQIFAVSGMILNPGFYRTQNTDRQVEIKRLGLQPHLKTGLMMFGGEGSAKMLRIAKTLNECCLPIQLIFLCGRNEQLASQLRALPWRIPVAVEGFTTDVPYYMSLADFFIGKAGPGSLSEALAMRLPVIVERNAWTLAHERYNTDWVEQQGFGIVIPSFFGIAGAVERMLDPETYRGLRKRAEEDCNRAVFEIPELLSRILAKQTSGAIFNCYEQLSGLHNAATNRDSCVLGELSGNPQNAGEMAGTRTFLRNTC
jgi:1,2-diacylglycerol 3-beta-galactosyltransferase